MAKKYKSLREFYPFYLQEHSHPLNRMLHVIGTGLTLLLLAFIVVNELYACLPIIIVPGYLFAWIGHFVVEKNRPATFEYPLYSLISDFIMFYELLSGKRAFKEF